MNEQAYEQEISLGKVFYRIFRDWRKIFVIALAIAVIAGARNFVLKKLKSSDPEYISTAEQNYERELAAFRAKGETLEREITNLEKARTEQEEYNANSVLMKINPFRERNASLQLYVSTDYQILPGMDYQNIDLSNRILHSYITYMTNGNMYQYIADHLSESMELRYLEEILTVSEDLDNCMVTINVQGVDEAMCDDILSYALEGVLEKQKEITVTIGNHELNAVNQASFEAVNLELDELQKTNLQYVSDLSINLQEKAEELKTWKNSAEPQKEYTTTRIIKGSIKILILGFIIGAVLAAVFIAFQYIMSDKLQDAKELKNRFGLRVIAQIPQVHKKRVWVGFDRLFAHMGGLSMKESDAGNLAMVAARSVQAELEALQAEKKESDASGKVNLVCTGTIDQREIESLLSGMKWEKGYSVEQIPSILRDPSAVPAAMAADYVVLIEKQEESTYTQIERELEELAAWKKKVLGVIVIGVDAIP